MKKLIPSGIPQYLPDFHAFLLYGIYENVKQTMPKVLTLEDLSFGFVLWLIACGISVVGFLAEIMFAFVTKFVKNVVGLAAILRLFNEFNF